MCKWKDQIGQSKPVIAASLFLKKAVDSYRWEEFRDFFQIHFLRYLVIWFSIVPVLGYILQELPDSISFKIQNQDITLNLGLPFHWQMLWASSLFFVIALTIYLFRCPRFIKKYHSYRHYREYEHDGRWITREAARFLQKAPTERRRKFIERLVTKSYISQLATKPKDQQLYIAKVEEKQTSITLEVDKKYYLLKTPILVEAQDGDTQEEEGAEAGIFWEVYALESDSRRGHRATILLLLFFSFVLFMLVLLQHIWAGAAYILT